MSSKLYFIVLIFCFALFFVPVVSGSSLSNGETIYSENCLNCHGELGDAKKTIGVDFSSSRYWKTKTVEEIKESIKFGEGSMPGFSFEEQELIDLVSYLDQFRVNENNRIMVIFGQLIAFSLFLASTMFSLSKKLRDYLVGGAVILLFGVSVFGYFSVFNKTFFMYLSLFLGVLGVIYLYFRFKVVSLSSNYLGMFFKFVFLLLGFSLLLGGFFVY